MRRILTGVVNDQLLSLARVHPVLEQARGVRIRSRFENRTWTCRERRALLRINDFDRLTRLFVTDDKIAGAVHHDRAFAD